MACNRGRFEAVVFSVHVDVLMAQGFLCFFFFFFLTQCFIGLFFLLLHCKLILILPVNCGRMDCKQLLGTDPWLA